MLTYECGWLSFCQFYSVFLLGSGMIVFRRQSHQRPKFMMSNAALMMGGFFFIFMAVGALSGMGVER